MHRLMQSKALLFASSKGHVLRVIAPHGVSRRRGVWARSVDCSGCLNRLLGEVECIVPYYVPLFFQVEDAAANTCIVSRCRDHSNSETRRRQQDSEYHLKPQVPFVRTSELVKIPSGCLIIQKPSWGFEPRVLRGVYLKLGTDSFLQYISGTFYFLHCRVVVLHALAWTCETGHSFSSFFFRTCRM